MSRNWPEYNRRLVKRGEFYFSMDFLDSWERELSSMNRGKRGRRHLFPGSYIKFTSFLRTSLNLQFRQAEGVLRKLGSYIPGLKTADYTTLWRRAAALDLSEIPLSSPDGSEVVSIDASGFKATNRGDWMRHIWHTTRRGWIKVSIAVDVKAKKLVAIEVSDEKRADNAYFKSLVNACTGAKTVLADGAYDTRENFRHLKSKGIAPGIRLRKNASRRSHGAPYRARLVREKEAMRDKAWSELYGYGRRWAVEGYFSSVKRQFGETVRATSSEGMAREVMWKFLTYSCSSK
ncbi:MAG: IS5 family transposase, partial [Candidatus Methanofastidiosia archaeon]